ncbi:trans-resveratrol di-O-methyltransferase-like [Rutidosis leptorrhynchoides]|uniref:trans-resveratrol di-O-methyltransferase-like n=1 Tax=Rutidosis leptorrhynchoides TaxID=125765 RepID=UPI003A9900BF
MELQNDEQCKELLHAQAHIWNHTFSFVSSMSLNCAIQLEIPDIINRHGAPMSLFELTEALSLKKERSQFIYRLMRILVHSGFFVIQSLPSDVDDEKKEGYWLTPASRYLLKEEPLNMRPFLLAHLEPVMVDPWLNMNKWFCNDDINPFQTANGKTLFDLAGEDPNFNNLFNEAMASDARLVSSVILKHFGSVFEGLKSLVDVGSGTGTLTKSIAEAFPNISFISFDLPHVVKGLVGSKNLSFIGGDMFQAVPKADAALLKNVFFFFFFFTVKQWMLHDWSDEDCIKILKKCKDAIPTKENGGKVIIIEMVVKNDDRSY